MFSCPYLLGGLTLFEEEEEQQREEEYILYLFPHFHPHTCPSFLSLYCYAYPHASVLIVLVLSLHFCYPQIADAWALLPFWYTQLANSIGINQQGNVQLFY